jgi:predicted RNase H-like nuclease
MRTWTTRCIALVGDAAWAGYCNVNACLGKSNAEQFQVILDCFFSSFRFKEFLWTSESSWNTTIFCSISFILLWISIDFDSMVGIKQPIKLKSLASAGFSSPYRQYKMVNSRTSSSFSRSFR